MSLARLSDLSRRIDRLSLDPDAVRAPLVRLARPILSRLGWQPVLRSEATQLLLAALPGATGRPEDEPLAAMLRLAAEELEANVVAVERATVLQRRVLFSHAAWLRRLHELLVRAFRLHEEEVSAQERRLLAGLDPVRFLPPLAVRVDPAAGDAPPAALPATADASPLVELQLALVDQLVEAARAEGELLERRRRLLEGARRALLDAATALPLDPAGVEARQRSIAAQITRLDRVEAAGVVGGVQILHQIRQATHRGDAVRACAALRAAHEIAQARQDAQAVELSARALDLLWQHERPGAPEHVAASLRVSADELLGPHVVEAILRGYQLARAPGHFQTKWAEIRRKVEQYLEPGAELATLRAILAVDGCFEVGGVLSPLRVEEQIRRQVAVCFPTQHLALMPAQDIADLKDAVIEDPRLLLLSLATGRLLARRFIREEAAVRRRTVLQGEVRVFLLDGSGSMIGHRARVRDAILLAELATLVRRASEHGRQSRVALYYRYFSDELGPSTKVDSARKALDAIVEVTSTMRQGGTNLQAALMASYEQILQARQEDPDLVRAQIVLITDGEAPINEEEIDALRAGLAGLPVGISVIALGEENELLRGLVARQRARGERAFYHHLPDQVLRDIEEGTLDNGPALHLPPSLLEGMTSEQRAQRLTELLSGVLDEMVALDRIHDTHAMERALHQAEGLAEVGLSTDALPERERARLEALHQDRRALGARFDRWFPPLAAGPAPPPLGEEERPVVERIAVIHGAIADLLELGGSELSKQRDAIELLSHLLPQAGLTPAGYDAALRRHRDHLAPVLALVRARVRPPEAPRG